MYSYRDIVGFPFPYLHFWHQNEGSTTHLTYRINMFKFDNAAFPQFTAPLFVLSTRTNASFKTRCLPLGLPWGRPLIYLSGYRDILHHSRGEGSLSSQSVWPMGCQRRTFTPPGIFCSPPPPGNVLSTDETNDTSSRRDGGRFHSRI